jgi:hypothetical protein
MVQGSREIAVLAGGDDPTREIYIDGRTLPANPEPSWMGTSSGKWEGDTLVVETTGFKEGAWLDGFGHPRSEAMRITERFHRRDFLATRRPPLRVRLHRESEVQGLRSQVARPAR